MAEEAAGISLGLGLDISQFEASVSKARAQLSSLAASPTSAAVSVAIPKAQIESARKEMASIAVTPDLTVGRKQVDAFRADIHSHLNANAASAVSIPIRIANTNWAAIRREIAAGIGVVPIKVSYAGPSGKDSPTAIVASTVSASTGRSFAKSTMDVKAAATRAGIPVKGAGGPIQSGRPVLVGDQGPEYFVPSSAGVIHAARGTRPRRKPTMHVGNDVSSMRKVAFRSASYAQRNYGHQYDEYEGMDPRDARWAYDIQNGLVDEPDTASYMARGGRVVPSRPRRGLKGRRPGHGGKMGAPAAYQPLSSSSMWPLTTGYDTDDYAYRSVLGRHLDYIRGSAQHHSGLGTGVPPTFGNWPGGGLGSENMGFPPVAGNIPGWEGSRAPKVSFWGVNPRTTSTYGVNLLRTRRLPGRFSDPFTYIGSHGGWSQSSKDYMTTDQTIPRSELQYYDEEGTWRGFRRGRSRYRGGPAFRDMYPRGVDLREYGRKDRLRVGKELYKLGQDYPFTADRTRITSLSDREMQRLITARYGIPGEDKDTGGFTEDALEYSMTGAPRALGLPEMYLNAGMNDADMRALGAYPQDIPSMVAHEFGHALDYSANFASRTHQGALSKMVSPSLYGNSHRQEKFAELFARHRDTSARGRKETLFDHLSDSNKEVYRQMKESRLRRAGAGIFASAMRPDLGKTNSVVGAQRIAAREPRMRFFDEQVPGILSKAGYPVIGSVPIIGGYMGDVERSMYLRTGPASLQQMREMAALLGMQGRPSGQQQDATLLAAIGNRAMATNGALQRPSNSMVYSVYAQGKRLKDLERVRKAIMGQGLEAGYSMGTGMDMTRLMFTMSDKVISENFGSEANVMSRMTELGKELGHHVSRNRAYTEAIEREPGAASYMNPSSDYQQISENPSLAFRLASRSLKALAPRAMGGYAHAALGTVAGGGTERQIRIAAERAQLRELAIAGIRRTAALVTPELLMGGAQDWYTIAHAQALGDMADFGQLDHPAGVATHASVSPGQPWPNNRAIARRILSTGGHGRAPINEFVPGHGDVLAVPGYGYGNWDRGEQIFRTGNRGLLSGPKVVPFEGNLSGRDPHSLTLDARMARITGLPGWSAAPAAGWQRDMLTELYTELYPEYRDKWGLNNISEFQSTLWSAYGRGPDLGDDWKRTKSGIAIPRHGLEVPFHRAMGGSVTPYIVGERGRELFVPHAMAGIIPHDVMDQIPKRAQGGPTIIGKGGEQLFYPPEDGIIVPNHLMWRVPHAATGTQQTLFGSLNTEAKRKAAEAQAEKTAARLLARNRPRGGSDLDIDPLLRAQHESVAGAGKQVGTSRNLRGLVASFATQTLGGGREQVRKQYEFAVAEQEYKRALPAIQSYRASLAKLPEMYKKTANAEEKRAAVAAKLTAAAGPALEKETQLLEKAKALEPGLGGVAKNFLAVGGSLAAFSLVQAGLGLAAAAATPAMERVVGQMTGFQAVNDKLTTSLAESTRAAGGNTQAVIAGAAGNAGVGGSALAYLSTALSSQVNAKAGAQVAADQADLFRAAANGGQGSRDSALYGGYGGVGGGGLFAQALGGGKGIAQTQAETLADLGAKHKQAAPFGLEGLAGIAANAISFGVGGGAAFASLPQGVAPTATNETEGQKNYVKAQNESYARGAIATDGFSKGLNLARVGLGAATDEFKAFADTVGGEAGTYLKDLADQGYVLKDAQGELITTQKQADEYYANVAKGNQIKPADAFAAEQARSLAAGFSATSKNIARQLAVEIPGQLGLQLAAAPPLSPTAGIIPPSNAALPAGFTGSIAGGGYSAKASADIAASASGAQASLDEAARIGSAGLIQMADDIKKNHGDFDGFNNFVKQVSDAGKYIQAKQTAIAGIQATQSALQFNNQLRLVTRDLKDAQGLLSGINGGKGGSQYGQQQATDVLLQRQSQVLQFSLSQRQINFQTAIAGFTAPGDTPEARQARIDENKISASYAQKALDIEKARFENAIAMFQTGAERSVTDLQNSQALLQSARDAEGQIAALTQDINAKTKLQEAAMQGAQDIFAGATSNFSAILSSAATYVQQYGVAMGEAYKAMIAAINGTEYVAGGTKKATAAKWVTNASGALFNTSGTTPMIVGEAGAETVAVLRNPRLMTGHTPSDNPNPAALGGSGGGGGGFTFNITIAGGGGSIDQNQLEAWAELIKTNVERSLNRRTSLLGLRST